MKKKETEKAKDQRKKRKYKKRRDKWTVHGPKKPALAKKKEAGPLVKAKPSKRYTLESLKTPRVDFDMNQAVFSYAKEDFIYVVFEMGTIFNYNLEFILKFIKIFFFQINVWKILTVWKTL